MTTRLRWILAAVFSLALSFGAAGVGTRAITVMTPEFSIAAGDIDHTSAILWARVLETGNLTFEVNAVPSSVGKIVTRNAVATDPAIPVKVEIDGLESGIRYQYAVSAPSGKRLIGTFVTAAAPGTRRGLSFGVTGDWQQKLAPYPAISNVAAMHLDFFVLLGDTIYADSPSRDVPLRQARTLADFRAKHNESVAALYGLNVWAQVRASTALFAMIDDHEVTNDFAGGAPISSDRRFSGTGTYINESDLYRNGLQAFLDYHPIRDERWQTNDPVMSGRPKLYRYRRFGGDAAVFMLDARSFRSQPLRPVPLTQITEPQAIQRFITASHDPARSLLGVSQLDQLKQDLTAAQAAGVTWKFILLPQPIQNFGMLNAQDRYEGYAAERTALLDFVTTSKIPNVVFITADFHGTIVNNLTYALAPDSEQRPTDMWEIITGPVAHDSPFGPLVAQGAFDAGIVSKEQKALYEVVPLAAKDDIVRRMLDIQVQFYGYDAVGLNNSGIPAQLLTGGYVAVHTYGWTKFEIDAGSRALTVTTYGIRWYTQVQMDKDPAAITRRVPAVISQFVVQAQ